MTQIRHVPLDESLAAYKQMKEHEERHARARRAFFASDNEPKEMLPSYGQSIRWTRGNGICEIRVSGCRSFDEAKREVVKIATQMGWSNPRWWQFWRWSDTRITED